MPTLSARDIYLVASNAGWSGSDTVKAVAIALAESGGRSDATNKNTNKSTDYGLWQINSIHTAILRNGSWSNPQDNAIMAHAVYEGAGGKFTPWVAYKSGRYLAFMSVARRAAQGGGGTLPSLNGAGTRAPSGGGTGGGNAVPSGLSLPNPLDALDAFATLAALLTNPKTWLRMAMLAGGLLLLYWGVKSATTLDEAVSGLKRKIGGEVAAAYVTKGASLAAKGTS